MSNRKKSAFTLIELLVVIAIIALLIAILLPSLGSARNTAKQVVCSSNLRQMGIAMAGYTKDNQGFFPGDHWQDRGTLNLFAWPGRLRVYMGDSTDGFWCPSTLSDFKWVKTYRDSAIPSGTDGQGSPTLFGYEEFERPLRGTRQDMTITYGYNGWGVGDIQGACGGMFGLGGHVAWTNRDNMNERRLWEIPQHWVQQPSDMIALADNTVNFNWDAWITPKTQNWRNWPGDRHFDGSNVLFVDGHAKHMKQKDLIDNPDRTIQEQKRARRRWNFDYDPRLECL